MRAIKITFWICFSCLIMVTLYTGGIALRVNSCCPKLEVRPYTQNTAFEYNTKTDYSISDIRNLIESDFDIGLYFYKETSIKYAGAVTHFTIRLIRVDKMTLLSKEFYAYTMAHELTHLKYYDGDECWTNYMAWKYLYESKNEFLHNVGLWLANDITRNNLQDSYDCGWWIMEYFRINLS